MKNDFYVMNSPDSEHSVISVNQKFDPKLNPFNNAATDKINLNYEPNIGEGLGAFAADDLSALDSRAGVKSANKMDCSNKLQPFEIQKLIDENKRESTEYTVILSSILRQIAFTEGSLFWFLKIQFQVNIISIIIGFTSLLLFFIFDAAQYYSGYTKFKKQAAIFEENRANKMVNESDYQDSQGLHLSTTLPFKVKLIFLLIATVALVVDFLHCLPNLKFS
jgi:hypothetical protein